MNLKEWFVPIILALIAILGVSYIAPVRFVDVECYKNIALEVCGDKELRSFTVAHYRVLKDENFSCCELGNKDSREYLEYRDDCDYYVFVESDHTKCSTTYRYWREQCSSSQYQ